MKHHGTPPSCLYWRQVGRVWVPRAAWSPAALCYLRLIPSQPWAAKRRTWTTGSGATSWPSLLPTTDITTGGKTQLKSSLEVSSLSLAQLIRVSRPHWWEQPVQGDTTPGLEEGSLETCSLHTFPWAWIIHLNWAGSKNPPWVLKKDSNRKTIERKKNILQMQQFVILLIKEKLFYSGGETTCPSHLKQNFSV